MRGSRVPMCTNSSWLVWTDSEPTRVPSSHFGAGLDEQLAQQRAVAPGFVLAIAADRQVGPVGESGEQGQQALSDRGAHFGAVAPHVRAPARRRELVRVRVAHQLGARSEVRDPDVVVVEARVVRLPDAARRPPDRPQSEPLVRKSRTSEADDAYRHYRPSAVRRMLSSMTFLSNPLNGRTIRQ